MARLTNFLNEYKKAIQDQPLEADLALFSRLAGLPFEDVLERPDTPVKLSVACILLIQHIEQTAAITLPTDYRLLEQIINNNRYQEVEITNPTSGNGTFSAITFILSQTTKVIAFCGPAGTLLSWKSDLQFITSATEDARQLSLTYLKHALKTEHQQILVVGFSKGATLATLSCYELSSTELAKISQITLFESPGFSSINSIKIPIQEFLAPLSLFGLIGEHPYQQFAIQSTANGIWQHDLYTWEIDGNGAFKRTIGLEDTHPKVSPFKQCLPAKIQVEQVERSIDLLFTIFSELGCTTPAELIKNWQQFMTLIKNKTENENIMVKMTINRIQKLIFQKAALNLQSISLN